MPGRILNVGAYPFSAIYGVEDAKRALLCALVNPKIKSVLISGKSGTAKTTLARSLQSDLSGRSIINVPLNVTNEQLFGSLDIEAAIKYGIIKIEEGILHRANSNILYMDDINLFDQRIINSIMEGIISGTVRVERENISANYRCDTILIATINSSETHIRPHFLDYFDVCVTVTYPDDFEDRSEITKRNLDFTDDIDSFRSSFEKKSDEVKNILVKARDIFSKVTISREIIDVISELCIRLGVEGSRGDLATANVAKTLAALEGRYDVSTKDVAKAAVYCLSHRKTKELDTEEKEGVEKSLEDPVMFSGHSHVAKYCRGDASEINESSEVLNEEIVGTPDDKCKIQLLIEEVIFEIEDKFKVTDYLTHSERSFNVSRKNEMNIASRNNDRTGKYIKSRAAVGKVQDLALDATIRVAAPYQIDRHYEKNTPAIILERQDLREKIRHNRPSNTFLFMVDNSGSLVIGSRMRAVKGAIMSMLRTHYVKRDKVGFMKFSGETIAVSISPSKSVSTIQKLLEKLPVGSNTPLSSALLHVSDYMGAYIRKHPDEKCHIILITDGKANVSITEGSDPIEEALEIASTMSIPNIEWTVIDTGIGASLVETTKTLATNLGGKYITIDDLKAND